MNPFTHLPVLLLFVLLVACSEDSVDPGPPANEEEEITTINVLLSDSANANNMVSAQWRDLDGDGGNAPEITGLTLQAERTYLGRIELRNENDGEDITAEIAAEDEAHQFFYSIDGGLSPGTTIIITDRDANNLPVGLRFTLRVSTAASGQSGNLNILLYHYDQVVKDGTSPSNETDVDVLIPMLVN